MEPSNIFLGIYLENNLNQQYIKFLLSKEIKFILKIFSENLITELPNFSIQLQASSNMWNKTVQMVQYFLSNSNAGWFYQGIDNTYFHFENFQTLIQQLLVEEGNALSNFIVKGNSNVGFLLSRLAAEQFVKFAEYSDLSFDKRFVKFLENYNKNLNQFSDNRFISFENKKETKDCLVEHKFNHIEICPTERSHLKKFGSGIQPLKSMAIFNYEIPINFEEDSKSIDDDIFVYQNGFGNICRVLNKTEVERFRQKRLNFTNK